MLDLAPQHLKIVLDILRNHVPDRAVWAFGSRVKGTARRYSDLDLAIISGMPLSFLLLGAMQEAFSDSDLPFRVDLLDWALAAPNFRRIVEQDRFVLQAASAAMT